MIYGLQQVIEDNRRVIYPFLKRCIDLGKKHLLRTEISSLFADHMQQCQCPSLQDSIFERMIHHSEEAVVHDRWIYFAVRMGVADWHYFQFQSDEVTCTEVNVAQFLKFKERLIETSQDDESWTLEVDLAPFERGFPMLKETHSIGHGAEFLNRHLARQLTGDQQKKLFDFLRVHRYGDIQLLLNDHVQSIQELQRHLREARRFLKKLPPETEWSEFYSQLPSACFEPGWGRTAALVNEMMGLLQDVLESPEPRVLQEFLSRIPMISKLAILSPHGYFGQSNVLGMPDTGGQVVYILDQVRALESQMRQDLYNQGLDAKPDIVVVTRQIPDAGDTTCNQRIEEIIGTTHARILRVPFRNENGEIIPNWISRFDIWPYLERFSMEVERELLSEMQGKPDLIIGNYSDGNLVASLLAQSMDVTQCNIAHALEKTKYLFSALNWKKHEEEHNFSCQFTADLIAMNTADFIITSTYQEIAGTEEGTGQYESYTSFTMPDLYRVVRGINVFDPKFNIVSPGADSNVYFPYSNQDERLLDLHSDIEHIIYGQPSNQSRGQLTNREKPLIFSMSRLDSIKNVTGLVELYGQNKDLQELADLFIVSGKVDPSEISDREEYAQCEKLHQLMDEYELDGCVRWVSGISDKNFNGELYRYIADKKGVFVQPALFEAFGLTVIEAMSSGLPTFATCYGGPLEIIENGKSGFHIDPNNGDEIGRQLIEFFRTCQEQDGFWEKLSQGALHRIEEAYTWTLYAQRLLTLSRVYGFWKHISNIEREETRRYLEMFYGLMYRPRAAALAPDSSDSQHADQPEHTTQPDT